MSCSIHVFQIKIICFCINNSNSCKCILGTKVLPVYRRVELYLLPLQYEIHYNIMPKYTLRPVHICSLLLQWLRQLFADTSQRRPGFDPRAIHVEILLGQVVWEQISLRVFLASIIPPMLHTHTSFIHLQRYINLAILSFVKQSLHLLFVTSAFTLFQLLVRKASIA